MLKNKSLKRFLIPLSIFFLLIQINLLAQSASDIGLGKGITTTLNNRTKNWKIKLETKGKTIVGWKNINIFYPLGDDWLVPSIQSYSKSSDKVMPTDSATIYLAKVNPLGSFAGYIRTNVKLTDANVPKVKIEGTGVGLEIKTNPLRVSTETFSGTFYEYTFIFTEP